MKISIHTKIKQIKMLIFQFYVKYHWEECNLLYFKQYLPRIFLLIHNKLHIVVKICLKVINLILFPRKISFIWFSHKRWFEYESWIMELNDWAEPDLNQVKYTWLLIYMYQIHTCITQVSMKNWVKVKQQGLYRM